MKIIVVKSNLLKAGYRHLKDRGNGSHSVFSHPANRGVVVVSGKNSKDAKPYQIKALKVALKQVQQA